jgi:hypothetical protein
MIPSSPERAPFPRVADFRHQDARDGFEAVYCEPHEDGCRIEGHTTAVEAGEAWSIGYRIALDAGFFTLRAVVVGRSQDGSRSVTLEQPSHGRWLVDGAPAPHLDGCLDVDLESSAFTNAFPVRRLRLRSGQAADAPAAYVRAPDLRVERLEQRYARLDADGPGGRYSYASPAFGLFCEIGYDERGVVLVYPGIARRVA